MFKLFRAYRSISLNFLVCLFYTNTLYKITMKIWAAFHFSLLHRTANISSFPAIPDFNVLSNTCHKIFVIECYSFCGHSNALSLRFTKFCVWAHATHRWLSISTKVRQNLCMWTILHRLHLFSSGFVKVAKPTFVTLRRPSVP